MILSSWQSSGRHRARGFNIGDPGLAMMYPPHDENPNYYGSIETRCEARYLEKITRGRIAALKQWLEGLPRAMFARVRYRLDKPDKGVK